MKAQRITINFSWQTSIAAMRDFFMQPKYLFLILARKKRETTLRGRGDWQEGEKTAFSESVPTILV